MSFPPKSFDSNSVVTPEVLQRIRADGRVLLEATDSIQASLETGRFDEARPIAAELSRVLRKHLLLVDGVLDVLSPDEVGHSNRRE